MSNVKTQSTTIQKALSNKEFREGFDDAAMVRGWNEKDLPSKQWNYERGRMFAVWLRSKGLNPLEFPLKRGRWATQSAIYRYTEARKEGSIF